MCAIVSVWSVEAEQQRALTAGQMEVPVRSLALVYLCALTITTKCAFVK